MFMLLYTWNGCTLGRSTSYRAIFSLVIILLLVSFAMQFFWCAFIDLPLILRDPVSYMNTGSGAEPMLEDLAQDEIVEEL